MGEEKLNQAKRLLREYGEESTCGWCKRTADKLATAVDEFEAATPAALEFNREHTGKGELSRLDDTVAELGETRIRNEDFRNRLTDVLDRGNRVVEQRRGIDRPPRLEHERRRTQGLPGFVTSDQIGQQRAEEYRRYRELSADRRRGPIRERLAFGLFRITEMEGPLARRRNQT